jgi:hypothetical protein
MWPMSIYGHLVLRLIASYLLYYTSRVIFKGRVTMDEMVCHCRLARPCHEQFGGLLKYCDHEAA